MLFYGIGNCSYSSGAPARIALAILGVQRADVALLYCIFLCQLCIAYLNAFLLLTIANTSFPIADAFFPRTDGFFFPVCLRLLQSRCCIHGKLRTFAFFRRQ